ncbi:MAG: hypothetical protein O3C10_07285, partial [Chloroflexi bacterium]|nr:hypothetical protein [Chloroflexota bacterium]
MASERIQRRIERLLDQIDAAEASGDWPVVGNLARDVLDVDPDAVEAAAYLRAAEKRFSDAVSSGGSGDGEHGATGPPSPASPRNAAGERNAPAAISPLPAGESPPHTGEGEGASPSAGPSRASGHGGAPARRGPQEPPLALEEEVS